VTTNQGTSTNPRFGNFVVAPGGSVVLTLTAKVVCTTSVGIYNAHAQSYYLDPTRILANPYAHISPLPLVYSPPPPSSTFSASYHYASGGSVLGKNYNGILSTTEDVDVKGLSLSITSNSPVYVGNTIKIDATIPDATYSWTGPNGQTFSSKSIVIDNVDETMRGIYTLKISANGCSLEGNVNIVVRGKIIVPSVFTPNGDGIGDTWIIQGLENYPAEHDVRIFDIWGALVYSSVGYGYKQPWDGTFNGRNLPVGTYYYIIDVKDGITPLLSGYVAIMR
jgi:gliding motility-associated-like protein